jgi:hypothetical protein
MKNPILNPEIQTFINSNIGNDVAKMALQKNPFATTNWIDILNQIAAKNKAKTKLPTFFATENIIYPSKISVEQTSSEKTAKYKSEIVSGESLIDLTGGFGVDDYYFSKKIKKVIHCEINPELSAIAKHNFEQLNATNIECISGDSSKILSNLNQKFDWIYIDPSRRNNAKGKVFMLKDCLPNVPELLDFYFQFTKKILIKTAPILDITAGLQELKNVKTIHIIAVENEVKELLWEIEKDFNENLILKTINISKKNDIFASTFKSSQEKPNYSLPKKYLYEPNAAVMKSGLFDEIGVKYNLEKLHQHSHLYTSETEIEFCGRVFVIQKCFEYNKIEMKLYLENSKANVTTRNFSETVENIRKKWKINDGGNSYCFFTTNINNKRIVLICTQIIK